MKKFFTLSLFLWLFYPFLLVAQQVEKDNSNMKVNYEIINPSEGIDDAQIKLNIKGGQPPYKCYWSEKSFTPSIMHGTQLREGENYAVRVEDALGQTQSLECKIPCESISEIINGAFIPIVNTLEKAIFWDPFSSSGAYDPIIRDEEGNVLYHPNGTPQQNRIPIIVIWLVIGAIFFTISMKFINIRGFKHAIDLVRGKYDDKEHSGEVNHFQALATALSGTVGLGNIAGVAIAISLGGPGATFWMIAAGLLGMSSKFVECTLGVKYRQIDKDGNVSGGPMYYLRDGLKKRKLKYLGKVLAFIFAILAIGGSFGGGNMFQSNQSFQQLANIFPQLSNYGPVYGIIVAIIVGFVIIGGIKSIAKVTDKLVPFMAIAYVGSALVIIGLHIGQIGDAFLLIVDGAFNASSLKGGIIGVLIVGVQRAAFSNEAGIGSAAIAHSAVKTQKPITEGFVSLLEPFIDTVLICTMTALVIIFTGVYENVDGLAGTELTNQAFKSVFSWYPYLLLLIIVLFAFSTMVSWSYYGLKAFDYAFGGLFRRLNIGRKVSDNIYRFLFLCFIVVGASSNLGVVLDFSDMMILCMAVPNIIGLYLLQGEVRSDLRIYLKGISMGKNNTKKEAPQS